MITISAPHSQARLTGTQMYIDTGPGVAKFALYATPRVAIDVLPMSAAVVEIPLSVPCGTVSSNGLALTQGDDGLIMTTAVVQWARLFNRSGDTVADFDIRADTDPVENGELSITSTTLYAGGIARLTSAHLT